MTRFRFVSSRFSLQLAAFLGSSLLGGSLLTAPAKTASAADWQAQQTEINQTSLPSELRDRLPSFVSQNTGTPAESLVADVEAFPQLTASRVLETARRSSGLPLSQLDIVAAERQVWNGCFGLADPDQACSEIAISGWRVVVTAPDYVWVYHTDQDGTEIHLNEAASQLGGATLVPEFMGSPTRPGHLDDSALITVVQSGGIAGRTYKTVLFNDGAIAGYLLAGNDYAAPTDLGRLSAEDFEQVARQLRALQLEHLHGLRYPVPSGTADAMTVTVMPGFNTVLQYADSAANQLPPSLRQFHTLWNTLMALAAQSPDGGETGAGPFTDIGESPYAREIQQAADLGLMAGIRDRQFQPEDSLTREQLAVLVHKLMQQVPLALPNQTDAPTLPAMAEGDSRLPFSDVAIDRWSAPSIQYLHKLGLLRGYADGSFRPELPVTRAELVSLLLKMDVYLVELRRWDGRDATNLQPRFAFSDTQGHWADKYIAVMSENCRAAAPLNETGTRFDPNAPATRGYAAAAVMRNLHCLSLSPSIARD
ncbi:MAG: S-layer homology domain-containing protein [Leptolyngbya sp. SIO4C1]|nr:S-layer homology domain-containing protein [Leptolyngbya sp. SIO4C1]